MTSLKLLKNADTTSQSHQSLFHIDGTYKTNFNNFTMASLGRSNVNRKFYLIALCLLSKKEIEFFEAFKLVSHTLNINCSIMFMMQDACQSETAALESSYPHTIH